MEARHLRRYAVSPPGSAGSSRNGRPSAAHGITVIEMMVVLTVAVILLALAAPAMRQFLNNTRWTATMSDLRADVQLARSESIRRNMRVLLCPRASTTSRACANPVTPATWMNGWLVCYDSDANAICDATTAADPNPVRVRAAPIAPLTLVGPAATVIFFPVGSANAAANFTLTAGTSRSRSVTVWPSGATSVSDTH